MRALRLTPAEKFDPSTIACASIIRSLRLRHFLDDVLRFFFPSVLSFALRMYQSISACAFANPFRFEWFFSINAPCATLVISSSEIFIPRHCLQARENYRITFFIKILVSIYLTHWTLRRKKRHTIVRTNRLFSRAKDKIQSTSHTPAHPIRIFDSGARPIYFYHPWLSQSVSYPFFLEAAIKFIKQDWIQYASCGHTWEAENKVRNVIDLPLNTEKIGPAMNIRSVDGADGIQCCRSE